MSGKLGWKSAVELKIHDMQTIQLTKIRAPKASAMIESTIPAVAIPFGVFFFPEIPKASPTMPIITAMIANHPGKRTTKTGKTVVI